jgi:hypothetical protein
MHVLKFQFNNNIQNMKQKLSVIILSSPLIEAMLNSLFVLLTEYY